MGDGLAATAHFINSLLVLSGLLPLKPVLPCFNGLTFQKFRQRLQLLLRIKTFQRGIVVFAVLLMDNNRRMIPKKQKVIHQ